MFDIAPSSCTDNGYGRAGHLSAGSLLKDYMSARDLETVGSSPASLVTSLKSVAWISIWIPGHEL